MTPSRIENLFNLFFFSESAILLISTKTSRPLGEIERWASTTVVYPMYACSETVIEPERTHIACIAVA